MSKQGIYKIANNRYDFKNKIVNAFLDGVIDYEEILWWHKKF